VVPRFWRRAKSLMFPRINCLFLVTAKSKVWWPGTESNRRRQPFQGCLPIKLSGQFQRKFMTISELRGKGVGTDWDSNPALFPAPSAKRYLREAIFIFGHSGFHLRASAQPAWSTNRRAEAELQS
jgi:hypothetical protein